MKQKYECEKCGLKSEVEFTEGSGVVQVFYAIEDDHDLHSPDCDNPVSKMRAVIEEE